MSSRTHRTGSAGSFFLLCRFFPLLFNPLANEIIFSFHFMHSASVPFAIALGSKRTTAKAATQTEHALDSHHPIYIFEFVSFYIKWNKTKTKEEEGKAMNAHSLAQLAAIAVIARRLQ